MKEGAENGGHGLVLIFICISAGLACFPAAVMMICVAVLAPSAAPVTNGALVNIATIAGAKRCNVGIAAKQVLAWLLASRVVVSGLHLRRRFL